MNNARIAWGVAALLAVILVIVLVMNAGSTSSVAQVRDILRKDCLATDAESGARCARNLNQLSEIFSEFSNDLGAMGTTTR